MKQGKGKQSFAREHTGHRKHPLPTTQGRTPHIDITWWSILKSDWLYSLQPKMEKLYTVIKKQDLELTVAQITSAQSTSHVWPFATPWTAAHQVSHSISNYRSLLKLMSIKLVMPYNHLILYHPLLHLPSIFPSIRVLSNESLLCIRWPTYWSCTFSISPSNEYSGLISLGWTGWISLQSKGLSRVFSNTTVQKHQFLGTQLSL